MVGKRTRRQCRRVRGSHPCGRRSQSWRWRRGQSLKPCPFLSGPANRSASRCVFYGCVGFGWVFLLIRRSVDWAGDHQHPSRLCEPNAAFREPNRHPLLRTTDGSEAGWRYLGIRGVHLPARDHERRQRSFPAHAVCSKCSILSDLRLMAEGKDISYRCNFLAHTI